MSSFSQECRNCLFLLMLKSSHMELYKSSNMELYKSSHMELYKSSHMELCKSKSPINEHSTTMVCSPAISPLWSVNRPFQHMSLVQFITDSRLEPSHAPHSTHTSHSTTSGRHWGVRFGNFCDHTFCRTEKGGHSCGIY